MSFGDKLRSSLSPRTPAEKERLKKTVVYAVLTLSCLVCLWLIFAPATDDAGTGSANMELPDQSSDGMPKTKIEAYEQQSADEERQRNDSTVSALAMQFGASGDSVAAPPDEIGGSAEAYRQAQASLQDFYVPDYGGYGNESPQMSELQARLDELEMRQALPQQSQQPDEMALLERSYQLAAQYMGNGTSGGAAPSGHSSGTQNEKGDEKGKRDVRPVRSVARNVVSALGTVSSARGFNTSVGTRMAAAKNTVAAVIASDQSVISGQTVKLRTVEPMWVGDNLIPRNSPLVGTARIQDERLEIAITSVESAGSVYDVELTVYDTDGQPGINVPGSMEADALHEIGANMGSAVGSSVSISTDAGAQVVSEVGRGLLNGVSQYLTKKVRTVKVHLKAGYRVMLHQPEKD